MNSITTGIFWMTVQIGVFSLLGFAAYLVLRRCGPKAAATCAATVLALTLPLAVLVASPWPSWIAHQPEASARPHQLEAHATVSPEPSAESAIAQQFDESALSVWWQTASEWAGGAGNLGLTPDHQRPAWQLWIPWLLAGGVGFGLVRLAAGMWSISRLRRSSRLLEDEAALSQVRELAARLDSTVVELRESGALRSAATIGWRRPVLLLPADWRTWTESERQIVLAHELAHVARKDYLTAILARLVTAVHFYQPIVLWLGRQLRIQQELAADNEAASIAGDRQSYLTTLAQLALRADDRPLPWPARAFLPGTSMLIKRVAWLKRKGPTVEKSLSRKGRWTLAAAMTLIALAVAGIRGPSDAASPAIAASADADTPTRSVSEAAPARSRSDDPTILLAQTDATTAAQSANKTQLRTFQYVPADAKLVVGVSPSELAKLRAAAKLLATGDEALQNKFGLTLSDIEDVQLIKTVATPPVNKFGGPDFERIVIRAAKPRDWKKMLLGLGDPKAPAMIPKKFEGQEYYVTEPDHPACFVADDRTLIIGTEEEIQKIIKGGEKLMDGEQFPDFRSQPVAARVDASFVKELAGLDKLGKEFEANPAAAMLLPLLEHIKLARLAAEPKGQDGLDVVAVLQCDDAQNASDVAKTLDAGRTLLLNVLKAKQQAWGQTNAPPVPQEQIVQANALFDAVN